MYLFIPYLLGINDRNPFRVNLNKNKNLCRVLGMIQGTIRAAEHIVTDIGNWEASGNLANRGSVLSLCSLVFLALACVHAKPLQSCPTLWNPMDHSPPGSTVHGSLQARILEWVAMSSSRGSFPTRYRFAYWQSNMVTHRSQLYTLFFLPLIKIKPWFLKWSITFPKLMSRVPPLSNQLWEGSTQIR